jgi:hypothetical protein
MCPSSAGLEMTAGLEIVWNPPLKSQETTRQYIQQLLQITPQAKHLLQLEELHRLQFED